MMDYSMIDREANMAFADTFAFAFTIEPDWIFA